VIDIYVWVSYINMSEDSDDTEKPKRCNICLAKEEIEFVLRSYDIEDRGMNKALRYFDCMEHCDEKIDDYYYKKEDEKEAKKAKKTKKAK
jgi:hypothetical protein